MFARIPKIINLFVFVCWWNEIQTFFVLKNRSHQVWVHGPAGFRVDDRPSLACEILTKYWLAIVPHHRNCVTQIGRNYPKTKAASKQTHEFESNFSEEECPVQLSHKNTV